MNNINSYTVPKLVRMELICCILITFAIIFVDAFLGSTFNPVVSTTFGELKGKTINVNGVLVNQYLSVPYAKAPTGNLRFKKPVRVDAWNESIAADRQPPACIQYTDNPFPWYDNNTGKSEDCLYLNIWTPASANRHNKKAVLYWIFGGGFFVGSIRQEYYNGRTLASKGDIIVVTVNYRLGSFGFLFSDSEDAPGNVGLWDILAGLQWVNDHIENFGGDNKRITIAGESAGSIAVGLLSVSPLARGLYKRQIMQSGSPAYTIADDTSQNLVRSQNLSKLVGCANETFTIQKNPEAVVRCMQGLDAMELSKAEASLNPHSSRSFLPQYGDAILPKNARQAIAEEDFRYSELLIGNNLDEGAFQITTSNPDVYGFFGQKDPQINKTSGEAMIRKIFSSFPDPTAVVKHYLPEFLVNEDDYYFVRYQVFTASGDFSLLCPTLFYAEKSAQKGNNVYYYFWNHRPSNTPWAPWMGVVHFTEVPFVFGLPHRHHFKYKPEEVQLSTKLIAIWSNFVKFGKPSYSWPLYSKENPQFLHLTTGPATRGQGPHRNNCDFFRPYFGF